MSAAFDCVVPKIMIKKLQLLGGNEITCNWLLSLQSDRTHFVRIGNFAPDLLSLKYGCPQGSVLSPLIYTIYTADLEPWLDNDSIDIAIIYADDATVIAIGPNENECIKNSRTYPIAIYVYASNYLKANESKPVFMIIRTGHMHHHVLGSFRVGNNYVYESPEMVFLWVTVNNTLSWMDHAQMLWAIYEKRMVYYPPGSKGP